MITKYGYGTVGIIVVVCFILIAAAIFTNHPALKYGLTILSVLILAFTLYFFRDPDRIIPDGESIIVSPADGKVILIKEISGHQFVEGEAQQISIFMSPLNVHVNRIPIDGTVEYLKYIEGEYLMAFHDKADERNERSEIGIKSKHGKVFFTQVAGFIARRIIYNLEKGKQVKKGEKFGMIKFGSRVDVIVSNDWKIKVKEGDNVTAGETILYEKND